MPRFNFKAVVLGALVDVGGSLIAFSVLHALFRHRWSGGHAPLIVQDTVGLGFSFLGGLTGGRLARQRELLHALATVLPCLLLGLAVMGKIPSSPLWQLLLSYVGEFPLALLGGYCARRWNSSVGG